MSVTLTKDIQQRLKLGVKSIMYNDETKYESIWPKIYTKAVSTLAVETELEMKMFGPAEVSGEGVQTPLTDNMNVATTTYFYNRPVKCRFAVSREAEEDDQYGSLVKAGTKGLIFSFNYAKDQLAASIFNNATDVNSPLGDGQPLLSSAHPLYNGESYSNKLNVPADLSEASLEQILVSLYNFKDHAGNMIAVKSKKLLIPPRQKYAASRLLNSDYQAATNNNAINAIKYLGDFSEGVVVNPHIMVQNCWFVLTNSEGLKLYQRTPFSIDVEKSDNAEIYYVKGYERYSIGCSNPRAVAGSFGF